MGDERSAELDAEFRNVLRKTPIHRRRWIAVAVAFVMLFTVAPYATIWWTARAGCEATNRATHKVELLTDAIAAPNAYPKHASAAERAVVDATNRASASKRAAFNKLADHLLTPEGC